MADSSFFCVIEGIDGAGKTVVARHIHAVLRHTLGAAVLLTHEPHDNSVVGEEIRAALAKRISFSPVALAQAFALNRTDHLETVIEPFLQSAGSVVISDRYLLSSLVYQATSGLSMRDVYGMNRWARPPDLTLYLKIRPYEAYDRLRQRQAQHRELFENNLAERAEKYQAAIALLRDKGESIVEIDANAALEQVLKAALDALQAHGPSWLRIQPPLLLM